VAGGVATFSPAGAVAGTRGSSGAVTRIAWNPPQTSSPTTSRASSGCQYSRWPTVPEIVGNPTSVVADRSSGRATTTPSRPRRCNPRPSGCFRDRAPSATTARVRPETNPKACRSRAEGYEEGRTSTPRPKPMRSMNLEIDRVDPVVLGGRDRDGLRVLCSPCNRSAGARLGNLLNGKGRRRSRVWRPKTCTDVAERPLT
jgi:hypothetical protein